MPRSAKELLRRSFSIAKHLKEKLTPEERIILCYNLAPMYADALFATEAEPLEVYMGESIFLMYPTRKSASKIRIRVKT